MMKEIDEKELMLAPISDKDEDAVICILTDDLVKKTYMLPDFSSREEAKKLFLRLKDLSSGSERIVSGIYVEGQLVGWINDVGIDGHRIELGYVIHPNFHNRGYCTRALKMAIESLFLRGFKAVVAGAFATNIASIRVMEKAGMQPIDRCEEIEYRGERHKCVYYEIRRRDKIIFLDVDGVLNSGKWNHCHEEDMADGILIDHEAVNLLGELVRLSHGKIILHSGWRFWFDDELNPLRKEATYLTEMFAEEEIVISGKTPDYSTEDIRRTKKFSLVKAQEILAWLTEYGDVAEWIVLDDLDLHDEVVREHQIQTDPAVGLTENDIHQAYCLLNPILYVNDDTYRLIRFLGKGKGGYSYLVEKDGKQYVLKQIHHEPCDYYTFGNKIEAEMQDYRRLLDAGIRIPQMYDIDVQQERIVKEFIDGPLIADLVKNKEMRPEYLVQVRHMAEMAGAVGLNIDYYPTNFVVMDGLLYYIDYECNTYADEWSFDRWGIRYWEST